MKHNKKHLLLMKKELEAKYAAEARKGMSGLNLKLMTKLAIGIRMLRDILQEGKAIERS